MLIRANKETGGGGGLPSWMDYVDIIPEESTDTLTVSYDNTKTLLNVLIYMNLDNYTSGYTATSMYGHKRVNDGATSVVRLATETNYQGTDGQSNYGSVTVDDVNGTVTFVTRGGNYLFKHDIPYRVIFIYSEGA